MKWENLYLWLMITFLKTVLKLCTTLGRHLYICINSFPWACDQKIARLILIVIEKTSLYLAFLWSRLFCMFLLAWISYASEKRVVNSWKRQERTTANRGCGGGGDISHLVLASRWYARLKAFLGEIIQLQNEKSERYTFFHIEPARAHVAKDRSSTREKPSYKSYLVQCFSLITNRLRSLGFFPQATQYQYEDANWLLMEVVTTKSVMSEMSSTVKNSDLHFLLHQ